MFASTPAPPYFAVIFTSLRTDDDDDGYAAMSAEMDRLVTAQPGYLGAESTRSPEGLGITVSYWRSLDDVRAWKLRVEHLAAQRLGRRRWYRAYRVRVAEVKRDYLFER